MRTSETVAGCRCPAPLLAVADEGGAHCPLCGAALAGPCCPECGRPFTAGELLAAPDGVTWIHERCCA